MNASNADRPLRDVLREVETIPDDSWHMSHHMSAKRLARELRAVAPLLRRLGKRLESMPGGVCGDSYDAIRLAEELGVEY